MGESTDVKSTIKVVVPPRIEIKVKLLATRGYCEVPFRYAQYDTLLTVTGQYVGKQLDDGVYHGILLQLPLCYH